MLFPNFYTTAGSFMRELLRRRKAEIGTFDADYVALLQAFKTQLRFGPWRWQLLAALIAQSKTSNYSVDYNSLVKVLNDIASVAIYGYEQLEKSKGLEIVFPESSNVDVRAFETILRVVYEQTSDLPKAIWLPVAMAGLMKLNSLSLTIAAGGIQLIGRAVAYRAQLPSESLDVHTRSIIQLAFFGKAGPGPLRDDGANMSWPLNGDTYSVGTALDFDLFDAFIKRVVSEHLLCGKGMSQDGFWLNPVGPVTFELYEVTATTMPGNPLSFCVEDPWLAELLACDPDEPISKYPISPVGALARCDFGQLLCSAAQHGLIAADSMLGPHQLQQPYANLAPFVEGEPLQVIGPAERLINSREFDGLATTFSGFIEYSHANLQNFAGDLEGYNEVVGAVRFAVNRYIAFRRFLALTHLVQRPFVCTVFGGVAMESYTYNIRGGVNAMDALRLPIYSAPSKKTNQQGKLTQEKSRLGGRLLLDERLSALDGHLLQYDIAEVSPSYLEASSRTQLISTTVRQLWSVDQLARQTMVIDEHRKPTAKPEMLDIALPGRGMIELPAGTMTSFIGFPESGKSRAAHKCAASMRLALKAKGKELNVVYAMIEEPYQPEPMIDDAEVLVMVSDPKRYRRLHIACVWPDAIRLVSDHLREIEFAKEENSHLLMIIDGGTPAFGYTMEGVEPATTTGGVRMIIRQYCSALSFLARDDFSLFVLFTMPRLHKDIQDAYFQAVSGGSTNTLLVTSGGAIGRTRLRFASGQGQAGDATLAGLFDPLRHFEQLRAFDRPEPDHQTTKLFDDGPDQLLTE